MPLTLYPFIINRKSGFVKAFLRSRLSSAQQTIFIAATTCRQLPALLTSVSNSIAGSVLPPSVCEGAFPYARGRFLVGADFVDAVNNSNVPDDLPPSVCEGALPYVRGRFLVGGGKHL